MTYRWAAIVAVGAIDLFFGTIGAWVFASFARGMNAFENGDSSSASVVEMILFGAMIVAAIVVAAGIFVTAMRASNGERPGLLPLVSTTLFATAHLIGTLLFTDAMIEDFPDPWSIAFAAYFVATSALVLWMVIPLAAQGYNWSSS